jgi:hypothetical protein
MPRCTQACSPQVEVSGTLTTPAEVAVEAEVEVAEEPAPEPAAEPATEPAATLAVAAAEAAVEDMAGASSPPPSHDAAEAEEEEVECPPRSAPSSPTPATLRTPCFRNNNRIHGEQRS